MMVRSLPAVLVLVMALSGCATIPLASIAALSSIQLETTDLAVFHVAIRLPEVLRPLPGGVALRTVTKFDGEPDRIDSFDLVEINDPADLAELNEQIHPGADVHVFALSSDGRDGLDTLRQTIAAKRAAGQHGSMSLNVGMKDLCLAETLPDGPLYFTTLVKTSETGHFVVLNNRMNLREIAAATLDQVPPCTP
jgi:hypothetical protein